MLNLIYHLVLAYHSLGYGYPRELISRTKNKITAGVLFCALAFGLSAGAAHAQTPFYRASAQELAGAPGTIIHSEPMLFAPAGAQAYRVLYRSTGLNGERIAVSGVIVVPPGPARAGGRRIVAWAHPTTGVVPHCAPSLAIFVFQQMAGLRQLIEQGAVVAATD